MRLACSGWVLLMLAARAVAQPPATTPARPPIVGLDHVAFKISDTVAAQTFYGELLGYPVVLPRAMGSPLLVRVNKRQSIVLEPGLPAEVDDRLSHIALAVSDLPAFKVYLDARGVTTDGPDVRACGRGSEAKVTILSRGIGGTPLLRPYW